MCDVKSGVALEHSLFPFFCLSDYILLWQALSLPRTVEQNDNERGKGEREKWIEKREGGLIVKLSAIQSFMFPVWQRL